MSWLTPDSVPTETVTRQLKIPDNETWLAAVRGALYELTLAQNWEEFGALTPEQVADRFRQMFNDFLSQ